MLLDWCARQVRDYEVCKFDSLCMWNGLTIVHICILECGVVLSNFFPMGVFVACVIEGVLDLVVNI